MSERRFRVLVCRGPECGEKRNSRAVYDQFRRELDDRGVDGQVDLRWQSCFGRCTQGPNCLIREVVGGPGQVEQRFLFASLPARRGVTALYNGVTPADVAELTDRHILGGLIVRRLIRRPRLAATPAPPSPEKNE